jgi:predicted DNA-binding protein
MYTPTVSFRLKPEVYLKLEAIAAEEGLSPGVYLKKKLESDTNSFLEDLKFMKGDISEILYLLQSDDEGSKAVENTLNQNDMVKTLMPIVLESLLILREVAAPNKISNAQKLVNKAGMKAYNSLGV